MNGSTVPQMSLKFYNFINFLILSEQHALPTAAYNGNPTHFILHSPPSAPISCIRFCISLFNYLFIHSH